jgi:Caspase domain
MMKVSVPLLKSILFLIGIAFLLAPTAQALSQKSATQIQTPVQPQPTPPQTTEPASRQLQQGPAAQSQAASASSASPSASAQTDQISTLPIKPKRWALIIGVDKYVDGQISSLKGAANDARSLADALVRYAGFPQDQVIVLSTDQPTERQPTRVNILRRLTNLTAAVPKDALLLVSFAGHGMERGGQAFLLPSDAQISDSISFLEDTAISVTRMKELIKSTGVGQVMVLLDACRNDPGGRADAPNPLTAAYMRGFSFDIANREVQAFAIIYATAVGQRAYEYTEKKQGYFTWAIVEGLKGGAANDKGEVTLSQLVKYVQETVPKRIAIDLGSGKQQRPFANIEGYRADDLVLAIAAPGAPSAGPGGISTPSSVDPVAIELAYWDTIKNSTNPDDFKAYLDKYPDGQFAEIAKLRTQPNRVPPSSANVDSNSLEMAYWSAIKDSKNASDFQAYITKFPNGVFVDLARSRITALENEAREAVTARENAANEERLRNTHLFDVRDVGQTAGTLTVAPGVVSFEPKKANPKKNMTFQCSAIKRVEQGQSAFQPPHVNVYITGSKGKEEQIIYYTSSGGTGLFVKSPVVDVTANVISSIIDACKLVRLNK